MNTKVISAVIVASVLFIGCSKKSTPATSSDVVSKFVATDWSARPLFPASSVLNLSEDQFKALPIADEQAKSSEMISQLAAVRKSAAAGFEAGGRAAASGDVGRARKCFMSGKQCGKALDSTNCLDLVRLVGQGFEKRADAGL